MDNKTAHNELKKLRDSLSKVLEGKNHASAEEIREQSQEAIQAARKASDTLKKSLVEKIKDLPIVQKVSELGTAGSVAVSTAAVAQTGVAIDQTQVFVANVANDVVEERFEVPGFIDVFVDFDSLDVWGQNVLSEKLVEAQAFVEQVEAKVEPSPPSPNTSGTSSAADSKQGNASSSDAETSDTSDEKGKTSEQTSEGKETKGEGKSSSSEKQEGTEQKESEEDKSSKSDQEGDKQGKQEQSQEQETENKQETPKQSSQELNQSSGSDVKSEIPRVETPYNMDTPNIRIVSPTS